jgi:hypothetical protein
MLKSLALAGLLEYFKYSHRTKLGIRI